MQLIPVATKIAILQPNIGVGQGLIPSSVEMSMIGELSYFLGLQIKQLKNGTFVSQGKYIKDMLRKFGMNEAKAISTPVGTNGNLNSDASGNMVNQKLYRSMIESLLYVTVSRPDVMFSVHVCKFSSLT